MQGAGTEQLVGRVGQAGATLNGAAVHFKNWPLAMSGRTMLPLVETLGYLGLSLTHTLTEESIGKLSFTPLLGGATFDGAAVPVDDNLVRVGDVLYVRATLLAEAIGARMSVGDHGEFYLTLVRPSDGNPNLPQARFTTDKDVYGLGEPVKVEEYSFDPLGANVYLHWTNLQPAYFKPGSQTITLQAQNREGQGNQISRTIMITDRLVNTPLQFSLKYGAIGDLIDDSSIGYPTLPRLSPLNGGSTLMVSDSPEAVERTGALLRDTVSAPFRLVAYHINDSPGPARLCIVVKNVDSESATFRIVRLGDTAPERLEGVLGQVTLLSFLTDHSGAQYQFLPGESAMLYLSPVLPTHSGASVLGDFSCDHRFRLTVAMTIGETPLSLDSITSLDPLPADGRHVRGVFPAAIREFSLELRQPLPAKAVIGDTGADPPEEGTDPITQARQILDGNYGVTYQIFLHHARGVVGVLAPRGGLYKGVVVVNDLSTGARDLVRVPRAGVLSAPDKPMIFMRSASENVRLDFIPASGSQLPVHLVFYRP
jgi:hypothetical protein